MINETLPKLKLDIGCAIPAKRRSIEHKMVDLQEGADIRASMWELPFDAETVDEIWCSHALEHVPMNKIIKTLLEFFRVLKVGGKLEVMVPNFDYVAKYWFTGPDRAWAEAIIFGGQFHDNDFHRCAFNQQILRGDLEGVGFTVKRVEIIWSHNQETVKAVCRKEQKEPKINQAQPPEGT